MEPPEQGHVVAIPQVGGLHHRYQRRAAQWSEEQALQPILASGEKQTFRRSATFVLASHDTNSY